MKQRHHISLAFAALLGITAGGCSEEVDFRPLPAASDVEIVPRAAVSGTRAALSGAQDGPGFPASTDSVFAVSAFLTETDGKYDDKKLVYDVNPDDEQVKNIGADLPYFKNQPVRTDEDGNFHFNSDNGTRYYPEDGSHVYFYAFSPACATQDPDNPKKVSWTLTGQEDIMYARDFHGIRKAHGSDFDAGNQPQPEFEFEHLMTRLNFRCRREVGFADYVYITSISFKNRNIVVTLNLENRSFEKISNKADTISYELPVPHMVQLAEGYKDIIPMMMVPDSSYDIVIGLKSGQTIEFTIEASKITWESDNNSQGSEDTGNNMFNAGKSYNVNLRFEGSQVILDSLTVSSWNDGTDTSLVIAPE